MPRPEVLELGVETLTGVGPAVRRKLGRLGIETVGDLLAHRPRRYESAAEERTIAALFGEDEAVLEVLVRRVSGRRRGRLHILTAHVTDETGEIRATWFNQPWLETQLTPGTRLRLRHRITGPQPRHENQRREREKPNDRNLTIVSGHCAHRG